MQVQYLSFDEQISCFEIVKKAMIAKVGKEAAEAVVNAALFQIGLGECAAVFSVLLLRAKTSTWLTQCVDLRVLQGATTTSTTSCSLSWRTARRTRTTSSSASSSPPWTGNSRQERNTD
jgi:hypothetical protein